MLLPSIKMATLWLIEIIFIKFSNILVVVRALLYVFFIFMPLCLIAQQAIKCPTHLSIGQGTKNRGKKDLTLKLSRVKKSKGTNILAVKVKNKPSKGVEGPAIGFGKSKNNGGNDLLLNGNNKHTRTDRPLLSKLSGKNIYKNNSGTVEGGGGTVTGNKPMRSKRIVASLFRKGNVYKENFSGVEGSSLSVKGNSPVKEKRKLASWFKKGDVYKNNVSTSDGSTLTVKGNEAVRTKNKLASRFSKKPQYNYSKSAIGDALSSRPETKKQKQKRFKKTKSQQGLFEPGVVKTSKFPR